MRFCQSFVVALCPILFATAVNAANPSHAKHARKPAAPHASKRTPLPADPTSTSANTGPLYATREDVMQVADTIAQRQDLDPAWVRNAVGQARRVSAVARAAMPPTVGTTKNWAVYRSRFVEPMRIRAGVKFWETHRASLRKATKETGVPAEVIVGVIGVETIFGQQTGNFRIMDALCTLAFDFPVEHPRASERAAFFLQELEAYLALTHRTHTDPLALRGSYAGAMGLPQFMPSSWSKYAVDFDGDGRVDLFNSPADVIGSVANYFKVFQWRVGQPAYFPARITSPDWDEATLLAPDIVPTFTAADMVTKGVGLDADALRYPGPLALVKLQNGDGPSQYVAGTENFYAITRYNWSAYYAMAVIELGQAIAQALPKH